MKVLVCGGRKYADRATVFRVLTEQHRITSFTHLIHGNAKGADQLADDWAHENGVQKVRCPADWHKLPRSAGPVRNRRMLELQPDLVIAFPGGLGTAHMVLLAEEANIQVLRVEEVRHDM